MVLRLRQSRRRQMNQNKCRRGEYAYVNSAFCACRPFPGGRAKTPAEGGGCSVAAEGGSCSVAAEGGNGSDDEAMGGDKAAPVGGSLSAEAEGGCGKPTASQYVRINQEPTTQCQSKGSKIGFYSQDVTGPTGTTW